MRSRQWGMLLALLGTAAPAIASEECEELEPCDGGPAPWLFSATAGVGHANAGMGLQVSVRLGDFSLSASAGEMPLLHVYVPLGYGEPYWYLGAFGGVGLRWWPKVAGGLFLSIHATITPLFPVTGEGMSVIAMTAGWRFRLRPLIAELAIGPAVSIERHYEEHGIYYTGVALSALNPYSMFIPDVTLALGVEL